MIGAIHADRVGEPIVAGNWFSVPMDVDETMKGRGRIDMNELAVYPVHSGRIVEEQFFYDLH